MDLIQLKYFCKVAELKNFTKASAALHVAQPAITRQIQMLEDELGLPLLFRHSRGAEPTEAGARLRNGAEAIFRLISQTRADVISSSATVCGSLRIGFPPSVGDLLVGSTVAAYRRQFPGVSLSLHEGYSHGLRDALLADKLDMAILTGDEPNPLLFTSRLFDEQLWLLEPPNAMPTSTGRAFIFAEVAARELVQPSISNTMRQLLERNAAEQGLTLQVKVEAEALHVIKGLVRRGVGSHVSPYSAVSRDIESGEFKGGPLADLSVSRFLARRVDRPTSLALQKFHSILMEHLVEVAQRSGAAITLAAFPEGAACDLRGPPSAPDPVLLSGL